MTSTLAWACVACQAVTLPFRGERPKICPACYHIGGLFKPTWVYRLSKEDMQAMKEPGPPYDAATATGMYDRDEG